MKIYFQHKFNATCTIQKKELYSFELTEEQIKEAKKRDFKNQYFYPYGVGVVGLYSEKGKIRLVYYHSLDAFDELTKNHKEKESGKNYAICTCGKRIIERDKETAIKKLNKHIKQVEEVLK